MCLTTKNLKPYVAKEDIKVFKILQRIDKRYITPYQGSEVTLESVMKPDKEIEHKEGNCGYNNCTLCVEGGFIHAVTNAVAYDKDKIENENYVVVEAYIPKGTEFYLSDDFIEVAAKELYITDKIIDNKSKLSDEEMRVLLLTYPIENLISKDKVSIGWFMLDDKTVVHPSLFDKSKMNPIGIICEITGNEYKVISLEQTTDKWCVDYFKVEGLENLNSEDKIYSDDKGQEHCKIISKQNGYTEGKFPATKWCLDYETEGTKKGDWYLPACGELRNAILNIHIINAVIIWSSVGVTLGTDSYYWSSSEYSCDYARIVYAGNGYVDFNDKDDVSCVRAWLRVGSGGVVRG